MKALFVRAAPRPNGVTSLVGDLFLRGMRRGGAEILDFDMSAKNVADCRGCFACSAGFGRRGVCAIRDDMAEALDFLDGADALVCLTPVYFYSMSAQMKRFFDRCFPFVRGYRFDPESGRMLNETGFLKKRKKFVAISVASGRLDDVFDALFRTYSMVAGAMDFEFVADIARGESAYFAMRELGSVRVRRVLSAFEASGEIFARDGEIPADKLEAMRMPLSRGRESFAKNARVFWQLRRNGTPFESFSMVSDPRILLREMCATLDPSRAPERADFKFVFPDRGWTCLARVRNGECSFDESADAGARADVAITADSEDWAGVMAARRDVSALMRAGRLKVQGDLSLFAAMKRIFGLGGDRRVGGA